MEATLHLKKFNPTLFPCCAAEPGSCFSVSCRVCANRSSALAVSFPPEPSPFGDECFKLLALQRGKLKNRETCRGGFLILSSNGLDDACVKTGTGPPQSFSSTDVWLLCLQDPLPEPRQQRPEGPLNLNCVEPWDLRRVCLCLCQVPGA